MAIFIPDILLKEIEDKNRCMYAERSELTMDIVNIERDYLCALAGQHSARIENPKSVAYDESVDDDKKRTRKNILRKYKAYLENAWFFGIDNFELPLSADFIKKLALKADPDFFKNYHVAELKGEMAPYRSVLEGVRSSGSKYTPPYPAKVPFEMQIFIGQAKKMCEAIAEGYVHPVEFAAFCHFNIVRIHPFGDANGRTSRLVQDVILKKCGFIPAMIHEGERIHYYSLLENAVGGYLLRDRNNFFEPSNEEKQFFVFIGSKVNTGLDSILDKALR